MVQCDDMHGSESGEDAATSGDELLTLLNALAHPQRLRILAALQSGQSHVSQLARELGIGRPLLHLHLKRLEAAGLIRGRLELSEEGRAMRFYAVAPFSVRITPEVLATAVETLTTVPPEAADEEE